MKRGDIVELSEEAKNAGIPGCLSFHPFVGQILSLWETNDGGKFVDVWCEHENTSSHETTYHAGYLRIV
jgi:hypothetical protein